MDAKSKSQGRFVHIVREFRAPRELVFRSWTDPAALARWYAPNPCTVEIRSADFRPGGRFHYSIRHPLHGDCWVIATFREVEAPTRLVFTLGFADERGNPATAIAAHKDGDFPPETLVTLSFSERDGITTLTLEQTLDLELAKRTGAYPSWLEMLDKLEGELAAEPTLVISRVLDAPREVVFRAWTEPQQLQRWWGPATFTAPLCRVDLRPGGKFHFCMRAPDGKEYWNAGEYLSVLAPARIESVMWFSDADGRKLTPAVHDFPAEFPEVMRDVVTFDELPGQKTLLTIRRATPLRVSRKFREDEGWSSSVDKLAEVVRELAAQGQSGVR